MQSSLIETCQSAVSIRAKVPAEILSDVRIILKKTEGWTLNEVVAAGITLLNDLPSDKLEELKRYVDAVASTDSPFGSADDIAQVAPQQNWSVANPVDDRGVA